MDPDFEKMGTARCVIIVDVGVVGYALSKCAKHTDMQSMPILGSLGACPKEILKLHSLRLNLREFLAIYHPLMPLWTQVYKMS